MPRIQVHPDDLLRLGAELRQVAGRLREAGARLSGAVEHMAWQVGQRLDLEAQVAGARRQVEALAAEAEGLAQFLTRRAELFEAADGQGTAELGQALAALSAGAAVLGRNLQGLAELNRGLSGLGGAVGAALQVQAIPGGLRRLHPELFDGVPEPVEADPFWASVGPAPVADGRFAPEFQGWADKLNGQIARNWAKKQSDHAGTVGAEALKTVYQLTPAKVEQLWAFARENHVDPRLLLAILQQEGTGSFDTNDENAEAFGGNGPQPDWDADLKAALEGPILSKLRLYSKAVEGGFPGTWVEWVNWFTPIDSPGMQGAPGVYAADINWAAGVERAYNGVANAIGPEHGDPVAAYGDWMTQHGDLFGPKHLQGDYVIRPGLPPGIARPDLALWHEYDRPTYPGTTETPVDNFWWFPAPDKFCWHIERRGGTGIDA